MPSENELRSKICNQAISWMGKSSIDGTHKEIIDIYNSHRPVARGYAVKYTDPWCAAFVSAVFIATDLTKLAPTECGCEEMIQRFNNSSYPGKWIEDDDYIPKFGDIVMYDWDAPETGDDKGRADHVGIVTEVRGDMIVVVEGNYDNCVKVRTIIVDDRYIRGYAIPDYSKYSTKDSSNKYLVCKGEFYCFEEYEEALLHAEMKKLNVYELATGRCISEYKESPKKYRVTTGLRLRTDAGTLHKTLAIMPKNAIVEDLNESKTVLGTEWKKIIYNDIVGWASGKYLEELL